MKTFELNKELRIGIFEISVKNILTELSNNKSLKDGSQSICLELLEDGRQVQLQLKIVTEEKDYLNDQSMNVTQK